MRFASTVSFLAIGLASSTAALAGNGFANPDLIGFEQMEYVPPAIGDSSPAIGSATPLLAGSIGQQRQAAGFVPTAKVKMSFEGISQYDVASYARNFVPPDTMGAVGTTQFTEFVNGGFAVFGKNGTVQKAQSDVAFWAAAGQSGANGDSRVLFDKASQRWVALSFGASVSDIQIAVSDTADATGGWKSTKFTGYSGPGGAANSVADYPTLAIGNGAVYIGTNNFGATAAGQPENFRGTTLNVIPLGSLVNASAPTTTGLKQFVYKYDPATGGAVTPYAGYAIQGVNNSATGGNGKVVAESLYYNDLVSYNVNGAGSGSPTISQGHYLGVADYNFQGAARQPNAVPDVQTQPQFVLNGQGKLVANPNYHPSNDRVVDALDPRVGSSVYEQNGLIYSVFTAAPLHSDHSVVRWQVTDAATGKLVSQGQISDGVHDYFEGSLSVNEKGQVVIGYNRSGSGADGKVSFLVRTYTTSPSGKLVQRGGEELLKVSLVDDYHNGTTDGFVAAGRQRWGDYSQVTLDPTDSSKFWVIGEFAREYNDGVDHPTGTGGSRWGTWISQIDATTDTNVPEPATWALFIAGFGLVGGMQRRRRSAPLTA